MDFQELVLMIVSGLINFCSISSYISSLLNKPVWLCVCCTVNSSCRGFKQLLSIKDTLEKHYSEQALVDFRCGAEEAQDFIIHMPGEVSYTQ